MSLFVYTQTHFVKLAVFGHAKHPRDLRKRGYHPKGPKVPKLPNSSLTEYDVACFMAAQKRRESGVLSRYDSWDVSSSQYGFHYLGMRVSEDDKPMISRFLAAAGRFFIEVQSFGLHKEPGMPSETPYCPFWRYLVHSPAGTLLWENEGEVRRLDRRGFLACEKAAIAALSIVDLVDMFTVEVPEESEYQGELYRP